MAPRVGRRRTRADVDSDAETRCDATRARPLPPPLPVATLDRVTTDSSSSPVDPPPSVSSAPTGSDPLPQAFADEVSHVLDRFVARKREELSELGADVADLLDAAERAVTGGKRLRPAFTYWGWRTTGDKERKHASVVGAAAAIELVHASALVHDDVMDDSDTRRGRPAAHRWFRLQRERRRDGGSRGHETDGFGRNAAILLGDLLLSWSDELLSTSGFKPKAVLRGRRYFDLLRTEVVAGQYLDVLAQTREGTSAAGAMRVVRYKAAKYTVERPLQMGAALGKAPGHLLRGLSDYGLPLGEAFQLRDDVLGVFGESHVTGKPSGDDIREGKRTLLVARAFDRADKQQARVLQRHLGDPDLDASGVAAFQRVLRDTGALAAVETVVEELTSAALSALRHAPVEDEEAREALRVLADKATNRSL